MASLRFLYMLMVLGVLSVMLQSRDISKSEDFNSANDDMVIENESDSLPPLNVFEPTREWKVIEEGQSVPAGLHVRMNLQTGLKEAKLLENDKELEQVDQDLEQENAVGLQEVHSQGATGENDALHKGSDDVPSNLEGDEKRAHYYGKSDRRGIINKRTKVFTKQELSEMLKKLNHDVVDYGMLPGIASSNSVKEELSSESNIEQPKFTFHDVKDRLPLTAHRDIEIMLEHAQLLANREATVPELLHALEELEYHVHQIDNAKDLNVIGGLVLIVRLLNHSDPDVRSHAALVIGSAAQSNPQVQEETVEYGGLYLLCKLIQTTEPEVVQRRALFAISALLRQNPSFQFVFMEKCQGFKELGVSFEERGHQVQLKAVVLLTDILNEQSETSKFDHHIATILFTHIHQYGWCSHAPTFLYEDSPPTIEKGLLAMGALASSCDFTPHSQRLRDLLQLFQEGDQNDFTLSLQEHCTSQLSSIRQRNREL